MDKKTKLRLKIARIAYEEAYKELKKTIKYADKVLRRARWLNS